jgi:hypothetical protein
MLVKENFAYITCTHTSLHTRICACIGLPADIVTIARERNLLPEAFLYGISYAFLSTKVILLVMFHVHIFSPLESHRYGAFDSTVVDAYYSETRLRGYMSTLLYSTASLLDSMARLEYVFVLSHLW